MERKEEHNDSGYADLNHSTSNELGLYRICPSKLTKRELEDLYYNIVDTNARLNNIIKEKQEKIKTLNAKMNRLHSAQKVHEADVRQDCCLSTKNAFNHTKRSSEKSHRTTELKRANERMAERIRILNIKLAAVNKEASKRPQFRNIRDFNNFKMATKANRSTVEIKNTHSSVTQTEPTCNDGRVCDENKCRTLMEELNEKIINLEAELAMTHHEYSMRIGRLELEVQHYHNERRRKDSVSEEDKQKEYYKKANEFEKSELSEEIKKEFNSEAQSNQLNKLENDVARNKHTCTAQRQDCKDVLLKKCGDSQCICDNRSIKISNHNKKHISHEDSTEVNGSVKDLDGTNCNVVGTTSRNLRYDIRHEIFEANSCENGSCTLEIHRNRNIPDARRGQVTQDSLDPHNLDDNMENIVRGTFDSQKLRNESDKKSKVGLESFDARRHEDESDKTKRDHVAQNSFEIRIHEDVSNCTGDINKRESFDARMHEEQSGNQKSTFVQSFESQRYEHVFENKTEDNIAHESSDAQRTQDESYNKRAKVAQESFNARQDQDPSVDGRMQEDESDNRKRKTVQESFDARRTENESHKDGIVQDTGMPCECRKEDNFIHEKETINESSKVTLERHENAYDEEVSNINSTKVADKSLDVCQHEVVSDNMKDKIVRDTFDTTGYKDASVHRKIRITSNPIDSDTHETIHGNKKTTPESITLNVHQPEEIYDYVNMPPESIDAHRHEDNFDKKKHKSTPENEGDKVKSDTIISNVHTDVLDSKCALDNRSENAKHHSINAPGVDCKCIANKRGKGSQDLINFRKQNDLKSHNYKPSKCECSKYINKSENNSRKNCDCHKFGEVRDDNCRRPEFDNREINTLDRPKSKTALHDYKSELIRKCNKCHEILHGSVYRNCSLENDNIKKTEDRNAKTANENGTTMRNTLCKDELTNNSEFEKKMVQDPISQTITFTGASQAKTENSYKNDFSIVGRQNKLDAKNIKRNEIGPNISPIITEDEATKQNEVKKYNDNLMKDIDANSTSDRSNTIEQFDTYRYGADRNLKGTSYNTDICMARRTQSCTNALIEKKKINGTGPENQDRSDTNLNEKVCGQFFGDITEPPPILADTGKSPVSNSTKRESNKNESTIVASAFVEPDTLVKSLTDIKEEQMKTVKELEHQLTKTKSLHDGVKITKLIDETMLTEGKDLNTDASTSKNVKETEGAVLKIEPVETTNKGNKLKSVTAKNDQHNSLQIPGPIPVSSNSKRNIFKKILNKKCCADGKKRQSTEIDKKSTMDEDCCQDNCNEKEENSQEVKERISVTPNDKNISQNDKMTETDVENGKIITKETDCSQITDNALPKSSKTVDASASIHSHCFQIQTVPAVDKEIQVITNPETTAPRRASKDGELPILTPLDVQTYRNQFGILCFKTTPAERYVCCPCVRQSLCEGQISKGVQVEDQNQNTQIMNKIDQNTITDQLEHSMTSYDIESHVMTCTPPPSNTQQEKTPANNGLSKEPVIEQGTGISKKNIDKPNNQTPSQNRGEFASRRLSGNDQRSFLMNQSLSKIDENGASQSTGCANTDVKKSISSDKSIHDVHSQTSMKPALDIMTKKLHSLSGELALCKELLLRQQSREERTCMLTEHQHSADISLLDDQPPHALRPGQAKHAITEKNAPRCIFTLHIGTVVLSDEAVLNTIDKSLVLRWKFYDQNVSMTRMTTRRVMFFDFSMEYDILLSEDFFDYMKREEMKIVMCELNDQQEAFATCALPLRDALLHTNRRVDMSLALVAGSRMIDARNTNNSSDLLDTGDEMGVIDLWCMLRADPKLLPIINRAIARSLVHKKKSGDSINVSQTPDDFNPYPINAKAQKNILDGCRGKNHHPLSAWSSGMLYQDIDNIIRNNAQLSDTSQAQTYMSHLTLPQTVPIDTGIPLHLIDEVKNRSSQSKSNAKDDRSKPKDEISHKSDAAEQKEEDMFIDEVIANIKTPEDMQKIMKENQTRSVHSLSRLPKFEDDLLSQARSSMLSYGHYRDTHTRDKKRGAKSRQKTNHPLAEHKGRDSEASYLPPLLLPEETSEKCNIPQRYENIAKLYGAKLEQERRQVTIAPKASTEPINQIDNKSEVPQKDEPNQKDPDDSADELHITILWLALNEECEVMLNPHIQRVYVAYTFLGKSGADLETPFSLPKPKHHVDKCYFNFRKSFRVEAEDIPQLGHMVRCRAHSSSSRDPRDCIVFSVVSEPPEDPLGMETCEDLGYAYLYFGDLLACSAGSPTYTEVIPVTACTSSSICGVLAIRVDGLDILRRCFELTRYDHVPEITKY